MQKLDERDFRRQDFSGGVPIVLADGQSWYFAEPLVRFVPSEGDVGFEVYLYLPDDKAFNECYLRYTELTWMPRDEIAKNTDEFITLELELAKTMLLRNYELPLWVMKRILQVGHDPRDEEGKRIHDEIVCLLMGIVPKPSAGGDGPSHTPPATSDSATA
jgi:hypothetical protein